MQNQQQVNLLLGMRMQEQQNMFDNQYQATVPAYEQYNLKQQAIGTLGNQGRTYVFDALSKLPEYLQYLPYDNESNDFIRGSWKKYNEYQFNPSPAAPTQSNPANMGQLTPQTPFKLQ